MSSRHSLGDTGSFNRVSTAIVPSAEAKQAVDDDEVTVREHKRAEFSEKFALQVAESRTLAKQRAQRYIFERTSNRGIYRSECDRLNVSPESSILRMLSDTPCEYDLRQLDLRGRGLTSLETFFDLVRMNKRLDLIDVCDNDLRNEDLALLIDVLKQHPTIRELRTAGNPRVIYGLGLLHLFHELARHCPNIKTIQLQHPHTTKARVGAHDTLQGWLGSRPENILFFLEQHREMAEPISPPLPLSRMQAVKRAMHVFIQAKQQMNPSHGFCLCGLKEKALDLAPFEDSFETPIPVLAKRISDMQVGKENYGALDFTSVLEVCETKMEECRIAPRTGLPHVFRAIVILGRSGSFPTISLNATATRVLQSPNFFLDVVFVHRPVTDTTYYQMQEVFHAIVDVSKNTTTSSYIFECAVSANSARRTDKLALAFGTLLAHPLQRPYQQIKFTTGVGVTVTTETDKSGEVTETGRPQKQIDPEVYLALRKDDESQPAAETEVATGLAPDVVVGPTDFLNWREEEIKYSPPIEGNPRRKVALRRKLRRPAEPDGPVDDRFVCQLCGDIYNSPQQNAHCGDRYCAQCIEDHMAHNAWCPLCRRKMDPSHLVVPKESFIKALNAIPVLCGYGCGRRMTIAERASHTALCESALITCPSDDCDWFGKRSEVVAHYAACVFRRVRCRYCNDPKVRVSEEKEHLSRHCPRYVITCTRCRSSVVRSDLEFHLQRQCNRTDISCLHAHLGCTHRCAREQMKYHLVDSCIFNRILVATRQFAAQMEDTAVVAMEQGLPYLQEALRDMIQTSLAQAVVTEHIHRHFNKYDARQSMAVALLKVFGVPLEFDSEYHNMSFLFNPDSVQPFVLFCHLSPEFPTEPPNLLLSSVVYTERDQEMPLPARCKLQKFEFNPVWSADSIAAAIHRKLYNSIPAFERLCAGKGYTDA
eukprot:TRINITY_DN14899_c0_g1_i1.p1 TRINITY_DN14899_c0_g1~~TRINITY_DN14899_c0_g1_i1.p1  ORF type:complete len:942 (-),score=146.23 TRINITY_DN14899_c0_g1_i1:17-2815(-)